jgi:hypothetical protein
MRNKLVMIDMYRCDSHKMSIRDEGGVSTQNLRWGREA